MNQSGRSFLDRVRGSMSPRYAEAYDETSLWASRFGALLLDEIDLRPDVHGLDVACGTGFPLIELAQECGPASTWVGIDVWDEALTRARQKIAILGLVNVRVEHGDAAAIPFDERTFDVIVSNLGINNFDDPSAVLRDIARVAKPGARVAITTNPNGHMRELYAIFREVLHDLDLDSLQPALAAQEAHRGDLASISALFAGSGLPVRRHVTRTFRLRFADGTALFRHSLVQWFLDGWRTVPGPEHEARVFAEIERRLNERASRGPLAFSVDALYVEGEKA